MIARSGSAVTPTSGPAPICPACGNAARLTDGSEIYQHRPDLHLKPIWKCDGCGAYVGCHPGGTRPLGTPADAELRVARSKLHEQMIDPLWRTADVSGEYGAANDRSRRRIRAKARVRVYDFMSHRLGIPRDECHTGLFDIERCRAAWRALQGITYPEIRAWALKQKEAA
ncbi:zinc-finger-containing protein [Azorhizobium doebereinerae]|uniref:zinc-finger-containing protein n=1 Tax=Azorhizobium doebereinerae TaxID=281091 RepID=UPI0009FF75C9|nr:zinc-finger-containing protein [Azorhizobium doebereinerae]